MRGTLKSIVELSVFDNRRLRCRSEDVEAVNTRDLQAFYLLHISLTSEPPSLNDHSDHVYPQHRPNQSPRAVPPAAGPTNPLIGLSNRKSKPKRPSPAVVSTAPPTHPHTQLTSHPQVLPPIPSKHHLQQPPQRLRTTLRPTHPPLNTRRLPRPGVSRPHPSKHTRTTPPHKARPPRRGLGRTWPHSRNRKRTLRGATQRSTARRVMGVGAARSER